MWRNTEGTYHEYRNPVEVLLNEVLLGSTADWSGDLRADSPLDFKVPVKLLKPGLWDITAYAELDNGVTIYDRLYLGTSAEKAGVLGSAGTFGQTDWMKDYCTMGGGWQGNSRFPMDTSVDLPNPPELGKPIQLSWSVVSGYDADNVKIDFYFVKWELGKSSGVFVSGNALLLSGNLQWTGSLKKGVRVTGIAMIAFPEGADWGVTIQCRDVKNTADTVSGIYLNVSSAGGRWGWVESHEAPVENPPPMPEGPAR
jgi:hypothetical protein